MVYLQPKTKLTPGQLLDIVLGRDPGLIWVDSDGVANRVWLQSLYKTGSQLWLTVLDSEGLGTRVLVEVA